MPLIKSKSRRAFVSNLKAEIGSGKPRNQALAIAYAVKRRAKRAAGGGVDYADLADEAQALRARTMFGDVTPPEPLVRQPRGAFDYGVVGEALPEHIGREHVIDPVVTVPKSMFWDLPHRAINAAKGTTYGLRREDFTDVPPDYSPDESKFIAPLGLPKGGWQPTDEMIGASLEGATNVMGGTALSTPGRAAGEFIAGAGPRDPALWHGISKVKLPKPIAEMSAVHTPASTFAERFVDPASLQGSRLLPLIGDRTRAGTNLQQVNGYRFDQPVSMQGGHGFMVENADKGAAWASKDWAARRVANVARREAEAAEGAPIYGVYTAMGERSGDFSHHVSDTLAEMLKHTKITKAARREFDDTMRLIAPDWPGVNSDKLRPYLANATGELRSNFAKLMDTAKYQNQGFPSVAEARFATTDPRLLNVETGAAGQSIARMDAAGRTFQAPGQHLSYDTNIAGQYVGGLPTSIPKEVMYPDIVRSLEGYRDALPGYKPTIDYLMTRTPKGLPVTQEANQKWVDTVSQHLEDRGFKLGAGATDKRAASLAAADDILDAERRLVGTVNEPKAASAELPAATDPAAVGPGGGRASGAASLPEAQATAARWAGERKPLEGTPGPLKINGQHFVPGPIGKIHDVAEAYMRARHPDRPYTPPTKYHPLDEEHSKAIAQAYEEMKHTPNDPATKASYDALINETADQYRAIKATGLKIEPIQPGMADPYAANPRMAAIDVAENNHLWFYPTEQGFGTVNKISDNPMLRPTGEKIGDHELLANDMFRIVHDYFGHLKEGHGFRAAGEDNAWRTHAQMYSDIARPAMTTETRGQNSWVNYGPHGEKNRTATAADTTYADQKVGLLPEWVMRDRGSPEPMVFYHGTPHSFDRFDISKIGAGEGNQAYGHGLYFAGNEPVSEWYRHQLAVRADPLLKKYGMDETGVTMGFHLANSGGDAQKLAGEYAALRDQLIASGDDSKATVNQIKEYDQRIAYLNDPERSRGHMYQVTADVDPQRILDYDVPFVDQPSFVQGRVWEPMEQSVNAQIEAIKSQLAKGSTGSGRFARPLSKTQRQNLEGRLMMLEQAGYSPWLGSEIYKRMGLPAGNPNEGAVKASKRLLGMDIPGLRYKDAGSRVAGHKGTYNYVMFNDDMLRILRKYGVVGIPAAGVLGADGEEQRATGGKVNAAMETARKVKRAKGGKVHVGPITGDTGGRADKVPMKVPDGAYVVPADIVSGLGEGNTGAGMLVLGDMFPESKPSLMRGMPHKGVPILAADGEFVISPTSIEQRWGDLDSGHKSLDAWVLHERQSLIDTLSNLDPPAQD